MILHTIINILYWMYGGSCGIHVDTIYPKKKRFRHRRMHNTSYDYIIYHYIIYT